MNYRKGELIGTGGMSEVFAGIAMRDGEVTGAAVSSDVEVPAGTQVALKYLRVEFLGDEELINRFLQEILACSRVDSQNITRGYDLALDGRQPVIVMELLQGKTLRLALRQSQRLSEEEALRVAIGITNGLAAAHAKDIVHRDIKPGNIHLGVGWPDARSVVKILDFGIARLGDSKMTRMGTQLGTVHYMSPEQIEGSPRIDARSDLYSLGIVLYEMLVGTPPFTGTDAQVMRQHIGTRAPELPHEFSPRTRQIVISLLAKDPAQRPQSAKALRTELEVARHELTVRSSVMGASSNAAHVSPAAPRMDVPKRVDETIVRPSHPTSSSSHPNWLLWGGLGFGGLVLLLAMAGLSTPAATNTIAPIVAPTEVTPTEAVPTEAPTSLPLAPVIVEATPLPEPTATPEPTPTSAPTPTPQPTRQPTPTPAPTVTPIPSPLPTKIPTPTIPLVVSRETRKEIIFAPVKRQFSSSLRRGRTQTRRAAQSGLREVVVKVTRRGGTVVSRVVESRRIVRPPVAAIILVGTARKITLAPKVAPRSNKKNTKLQPKSTGKRERRPRRPVAPAPF